jgi:CBS domain-containing protein/SAM-dependent methyltransferase
MERLRYAPGGMGFVARDIASPDFPVATTAETVRAAAGKMARASLPAIPVVDPEGRLEGVLTQADIVHLVAHGEDLGSTPAGRVVHGSAALDAGHVIERSDQAALDGIPMAPVVADGKLVGVVTPSDFDAHEHLRKVLGERAGELNLEISAEDEMDFGLRGKYLIAGAEALVCIRRAMDEAGFGDPRTILDLPSGHGRVMRFLRCAFPDAALTACDVNQGGVDFCAETFGARPVYSDRDLANVQLDETFDLIWCGALFMHLDRRPWVQLLSFLVEHLAPGGLLVFAAMGELSAQELRTLEMLDDQIEEIMASYEETGFGYQPYRSHPAWGISISSPEFVRHEADQLGGVELVSFSRRGLERQDVYAYRRPG